MDDIQGVTVILPVKMLTWGPNKPDMSNYNFLPTLAIIGICLLSLSSCGSEKTALETANAQTAVPEDVEAETPEATVAIPQQVEAVYEGPRKVVGAFRSVKGVMDPLSCYCSNGGYVESPTGETVAVCFDNNQNVPSSDYIYMEGTMTSRSIESNGACPAGSMSYLVVESYSLQP